MRTSSIGGQSSASDSDEDIETIKRRTGLFEPLKKKPSAVEESSPTKSKAGKQLPEYKQNFLAEFLETTE
jgi:hypothetical protein